MKRILVVGCPGSGKSSFSKRLARLLDYPILHLDRIFHIDNFNHISRDELKEKITEFIDANEYFIIDGNYSGTMRFRLQFTDTVFFFDIDPDVCLKNVVSRCEENLPRDDIVEGFDNSIIDPVFIEYVKNFDEERKPTIEALLKEFKLRIIRFKDYDDVENYLKRLKK